MKYRESPYLVSLMLAIGLVSCTDREPVSSSSSQGPELKSSIELADSMFAERCKKSGEFIHRTVENVEGVFLMKVRATSNHSDQFRMDDPYGHDSTGDEYLKSFFYGRNANGYLTTSPSVSSLGYRYVEAIDPADGKRYRYTGRIDQPWLRDKRYGEWVRDFVLDKLPAPGAPPRYGVTYDDISTREEREYWIAGSSLQVIDLKTNEVIAERIGYMMDRGQGNRSGGRSPWLLAAGHACPKFPLDGDRQSYQGNQTRNFVEKVLKPNGIE
jgi:hypothetical protein